MVVDVPVPALVKMGPRQDNPEAVVRMQVADEGAFEAVRDVLASLGRDHPVGLRHRERCGNVGEVDKS